MFFTQVSDAETFLIHVHVGGETLVSCVKALGLAGDHTLDLGEQLASRGSVPLSAVTQVQVHLSPGEAARLVGSLDAPAAVAIAWLWEDASPLGTYMLTGARPDGAIAERDDLAIVSLAIDGLTFED